MFAATGKASMQAEESQLPSFKTRIVPGTVERGRPFCAGGSQPRQRKNSLTCNGDMQRVVYPDELYYLILWSHQHSKESGRGQPGTSRLSLSARHAWAKNRCRGGDAAVAAAPCAGAGGHLMRRR